MTKPVDPTRNPDDLLADFADRILDGTAGEIDFSADGELRRLEETIVRLNMAFPREALHTKSIRRMQAGIKSADRTSDSSPRSAWRSRRSRQRFILSFVLIGILVVIFIAIPFLLSPGGSVQATAGFQTQSLLVYLAIGCVSALLVWLGRRK